MKRYCDRCCECPKAYHVTTECPERPAGPMRSDIELGLTPEAAALLRAAALVAEACYQYGRQSASVSVATTGLLAAGQAWVRAVLRERRLLHENGPLPPKAEKEEGGET